MIEMTEDLVLAMRRFYITFGYRVPLKKLSNDITTTDLIIAIDESIEQNINLLPKILN